MFAGIAICLKENFAFPADHLCKVRESNTCVRLIYFNFNFNIILSPTLVS